MNDNEFEGTLFMIIGFEKHVLFGIDKINIMYYFDKKYMFC